MRGLFSLQVRQKSNNTAIFGAYKAHGKRKKRVVISSVEHPAVKILPRSLKIWAVRS